MLSCVEHEKFYNLGAWISGVRSAMHAASQLPGRGPTDDALHLNDDDDDSLFV